jgi:hypothetical protein
LLLDVVTVSLSLGVAINELAATTLDLVAAMGATTAASV